jgi:prefoldin subunit 5
MEHGNAYQCLDNVRDHIAFLEKKALDRVGKIRELEADTEMLDLRLSEVQCAYAEVEQEKEELGATIRDLRDTVDHMCKECQGWEDRANVLQQALDATKKAKPDKQAGVHTTRLYWDCNCPKDYINHSYITRCEICGAHKADHPDSRLEELGMARLSGINELAERYARSNKTTP